MDFLWTAYGLGWKFNQVIISCSTCCLFGPVRATWVCASFNSNQVIISCSTCWLLGQVRAKWVCASFKSNQVIISCSTCCLVGPVRPHGSVQVSTLIKSSSTAVLAASSDRLGPHGSVRVSALIKSSTTVSTAAEDVSKLIPYKIVIHFV